MADLKTPEIEIKGLDEIIERMKKFPKKLVQVGKIGMDATLLSLWENVPPYPLPPKESSYVRTGTLGRTLGSSQGGGKSGGQPEIYEVKQLGSINIQGRFGTNLGYAQYVIGDNAQAEVHKGRWWTMKTIVDKSTDKIRSIWNGVGERMAAWLDRNAQ